MRVKPLLLAILSLGVLLAIGCKKDEDQPAGTTTTGNIPPAEAVATWTFQSATQNGNPVALNVALDWVPNAVSAEFMIGADGSYAYRERDNSGTEVYSESGTISISGQSFTVTFNMVNGAPSAAESFSGTWSVSENQLSLTVVEGTDTIVFVLTK